MSKFFEFLFKSQLGWALIALILIGFLKGFEAPKWMFFIPVAYLIGLWIWGMYVVVYKTFFKK